MSNLTITEVKVSDRGKNKKVVIVIEGLVSEEEAQRCIRLLKKPIYERRIEVPLAGARSIRAE
jgi:hypothetical protein